MGLANIPEAGRRIIACYSRLFARYSRVIRDIRELFGATNNLLFGVYPLDIHVYSMMNNYILHSETAFWASCYSEAPYSALF